MSGIGPQLPPHLLAKRKRQEEKSTNDEPTLASGAFGPGAPEEAEKRRRIIGPAMPPAPVDQRPSTTVQSREESDSDDDDAFGPALPPTEPNEVDAADEEDSGDCVRGPEGTDDTQKPKRDEWMTMPPQQDDLAARMDPSKPRARGFNTGKGARGPSVKGDDSSAWHESTEQKQKRLADEMMGIVGPAGSNGRKDHAKERRDRDVDSETAKIRDRAKKSRGPSLMEQHQGTKAAQAEDDPSQRAFDREKDMSGGLRLGAAQKREMLNKASSSFSTKFSGGNYL